MKKEIKIPAMGESISEATIGTILKPSGTVVKIDEEILELETDKVNQVLYAPCAGKLSLNVKTGDTVKIGQVIGDIDEASAAKESKPAVEEPKAPPRPKKAPPKVEVGEGIRLGKEQFVESLAAPIATKEVSQAPMKERETRRKMTKIRKVIASRLVEAQRTTAMLTTFNEIDLTQVVALREKYKESFAKKYQAKLGFMSFFVKAAVSALEIYQDMNSYIDGDDIVHREYYDIGIAVGTERGLIVPVVRDCNELTFADIELEIERFAKRAKEGTLTVDELTGGGFTITNGGTYGSLLSTPILNPPQSGILGMHKIEKRPVVVNDEVVIRPMMYVALSYDHRIVDGKEAVSFLVHMKNVLEDPARLLLDI